MLTKPFFEERFILPRDYSQRNELGIAYWGRGVTCTKGDLMPAMVDLPGVLAFTYFIGISGEGA
jgi:hypothetical protein